MFTDLELQADISEYQFLLTLYGGVGRDDKSVVLSGLDPLSDFSELHLCGNGCGVDRVDRLRERKVIEIIDVVLRP